MDTDLRFRQSVVDRHVRELALTGRTEFPTNSLLMAMAVTGCLVFAAIGLLMMWMAQDVPTFVLGAVTLGFFGVLGVPALLVMWFQRKRLVVRMDGFWVERPTRSGQVPLLAVQWFQVSDLGFHRLSGRWPYKGTPLLTYTLTPEVDRQVWESMTQRQQRLRRWDMKIVGPRVYTLPQGFGRRPGDVLEVMARARFAFLQRRT